MHLRKANNAKYSKTKLALFSRLSRHSVTQPGNEVGLFYNAPEPTLEKGRQPEFGGHATPSSITWL